MTQLVPLAKGRDCLCILLEKLPQNCRLQSHLMLKNAFRARRTKYWANIEMVTRSNSGLETSECSLDASSMRLLAHARQRVSIASQNQHLEGLRLDIWKLDE
jgi:hypothetical protein